MADIDVQSVGLASPPVVAYQQEYTPGILVRNNGVAGAVATGYLRMYNKATGLLLATWNVASGSISPDTTGTATSGATVDLSEFDAGTELLFSGSVTTPDDQVPSNNTLAPVTVTVNEGESPEPPVVAAHSAQHEDGGSDELNLENLRGELHDPQEPKSHASEHQAGGDDELNVNGLHGLLADEQPVSDHGNERHTSTFITQSAVTTHNNDSNAHPLLERTANKGQPNGYAGLNAGAEFDDLVLHQNGVSVHGAATNLEKTNQKGAANGYAPLDGSTLVPAANLGTGTPDGTKFLRDDRSWQAAPIPGRVAPVELYPNVDNAEGAGAFLVRNDHAHKVQGIVYFQYTPSVAANSNVLVFDRNSGLNYYANRTAMWHVRVFADVLDAAPGDTIAVGCFWNLDTAGEGSVRSQAIFTTSTPAEEGALVAELQAMWISGDNLLGNCHGMLSTGAGDPNPLHILPLSLSTAYPVGFGTHLQRIRIQTVGSVSLVNVACWWYAVPSRSFGE